MQSDADSRAVVHRLNGLGILLLVVGVAGFGGLQVGKARIKAVAQWPSVSGQIVKSEVSTATVKTGRVTRTQPIAETRYSYSVEGKTYESEFRRVVPMLHMKPEGTPEEIVSRYPVGETSRCTSVSRDPRDALLVPVAGQDAHSLIRVLSFVAPVVAVRRFADRRDCLDQAVVRVRAAADAAAATGCFAAAGCRAGGRANHRPQADRGPAETRRTGQAADDSLAGTRIRDAPRPAVDVFRQLAVRNRRRQQQSEGRRHHGSRLSGNSSRDDAVRGVSRLHRHAQAQQQGAGCDLGEIGGCGRWSEWLP